MTDQPAPEDRPVPGIKFDPDTFYGEIQFRLLGFTEAELRRARKSGALRCTEVRRGRRVYLGAWLITWLSGQKPPERA